MQAYSDFAEVYDELMDNVPYESWCENIAALIDRYGISRPVGESRPRGEERSETENLLASERDLVLDLGCGTGTLTQLLHKKGYDMIGVDNSPEMLGIAMEKSAKGGGGILYLLQDMRELELYSTVGTVLSVCDSLNYLLEEKELLQVFRLVNNYLYPGGLFLFDFNTVYKYSQVIGDAVIAENREDCSFIWENYYHEQEEINEYDLTVFVQEEGEHFRRFVENHLQRGYTPQTMCGLVEQAGMQVIRLLDADTLGEVTDQSQRVYVLAREQGKPSGNMPVL
ncbi:MAG: class I SAM-dependent methyltransferase [Acetatifactor sp.]|nr:class I SAM-dependent methyltransferase [Acetatifactor sp.]